MNDNRTSVSEILDEHNAKIAAARRKFDEAVRRHNRNSAIGYFLMAIGMALTVWGLK